MCHPAPPLVEYLFIDEPRLRSYAEQLEISRSVDKIPSWNVKLSIKGPDVAATQDNKLRPATAHEMITKLIRSLRKNDQLEIERAHVETKYQFAFEETVAQKVLLPLKEAKRVKELKDIAVWVSNPSTKPHLPTEESTRVPKGTFLYLLEAYWESDDLLHGPFSGFSALNLILSEVADVMGLNRETVLTKYEARRSFKSPLATLQEIGGIPQDQRRIQTLYRKRYISDDQYVLIDGASRRYYDLFAYPIYIASV